MVHSIRYVLLACLLLSAQPSLANDAMQIPVNRSELIAAPVDLSEVIVANPDIADVYVHGKRNISIIGKQIGHTTVRLFDEESNLVRNVAIHVTYDLPSIRKAIKDFLPNERIGVEMVNTRIALTGTVSGAQVASTAVELAEQFVSTSLDTNGNNTTRNGVPDLEPDRNPGVINLMNIASGQQVMLRIRVGEIQRSTLKNLGLDLQAVAGGDNFSFLTGSGGGIDAFRVGGTPALSFGQFTIPGETQLAGAFSYVSDGGNGIAAAINALERDGLFKTLAEPNLVAISGERAEFLAGGEFPIPVPQDDQTITIQFRPFGVSVAFTPFVLSENRIRVQVEPEVSETSTANQIEVGNFVVPSLVTRRASTTIEMAPGESFMIAGLIQDTLRTTIDQVPGLSEIPILSSFFRNSGYERNETELVLSVTPYIVDPVKPENVKLPTDDLRPASFMETVFYGALGSRHNGEYRLSQTPSLEGPIGFMVD